MPKIDQGVNGIRYCVAPRTLIFLFNNQENVLLLQGAKNKNIWAEYYNGIGGHIEAGEDIHEAAERELFEETGISNVDLIFCGEIMVDVSNDLGVAIFLFKGRYQKNDFINSNEGKLNWIDLDELPQLNVVEDLPNIVPIVARYQEGDPFIIGRYQYTQEGKLVISMR